MLKQTGRVVLAFAATLLLAATVWSQAIFATLTGVVTDSSGAVVAGAKVTLRNADSGDLRDTVTDNQGYYTFASVPVGTYNLTVTQAGFSDFSGKRNRFRRRRETKRERVAASGKHQSDGRGLRTVPTSLRRWIRARSPTS